MVSCLSVHVARRSDRREILGGWAPGAPDAEDQRRLKPVGAAPPIVLVGIRCWQCFMPELPLPSRGMGVARAELDVFLILYNLSSLMVFAMLGWEGRLVPKWMRWAEPIGRDNLFSFLTSLAYRDVMCRPGSIVAMSGCGGVVVVACLMGALR